VALAAGCAAKPPVDVPLRGIIQAQDDLNPSLDGRSSPLRISIFQLRKVDKFKDADFFALYDDANTVLGADMIGREDLTLKPGDVRKYEREVDPETRYIGVIGAYRDINQAKWLGYVEMPDKSLLKLMKRDPITITASRLAIDISVGD
jgi:type VI secretion system protein VasD